MTAHTVRTLLAGLATALLLAACGGGGGGGGGNTTPPPPTSLSIATARALWLQHDVLAWPGAAAGSQFKLYYAAAGGITVDTGGVHGADGSYDLSASSGIGSTLAARFPQLTSATALALAADGQAQARTLVRGQLVAVELQGGSPHSATQVQIQGVLDDLYAAAATPMTLGPSFAGDGTPTLRLWAPTAQQVTLNVAGQALPMTRDDASGVWSLTGDKAWTNSAYYTYTVQVWSRQDGGAVHSYTVTDPYATTLDAGVYSGTQQRAMVADLASAALQPTGWGSDASPALAAPEDAILYELHVRDFSANDASVPAAQRGKYGAFALAGTNGMQHLQTLAGAGVTHVHLLPAFDIASVDEAGCSTPAISNTDPTSTAPQAAVAAAKDSDCFNWGYDPRHYGAPEGSYASSAGDGAVRVREFRAMVQGLHATGLRVVMDVVYNHTAGRFLDQIVPGYYYRLNADGAIENSSCCENTATEFAMMEKLMTDTLVRWAAHYHVDGFRFDIMGHIPLAAVTRAQAAVQAAVGARGTYFYGEAWNFGEVQNDRLFVQARQAHLAGTGIGSFNDRIRDAVRGGGPFDSGTALVANQGFGNGECVDPNASASCSTADLQARQQWIRVSMAGGVKDFQLNGVAASSIDYGGQPAGYTSDPQELINYVGVHDGQTLYDLNQMRLPTGTSSAQRARAQVVSLAPVLLGQGVPFVHAGDELLRSKGFDQNSYNSGDWFNRIDWTGSTNYFNTMGLPPAADNQSNWPLYTGLLSNAKAAPGAADIAAARDAVLDLMRVRKSSTMFRLRSGGEVKRCVSFPDAGTQVAGLIVMQLGVGDHSCGDGAYQRAVVLINSAPSAQSYAIAALAGHALQLHPVQAAGSDAVVQGAGFTAATGSFSVPGRSAVVFVEP